MSLDQWRAEPDLLRAEIERLGPWHHDVEVAPGIRTAAAPLTAARADPRIPTTYRPDMAIRPLVRDLFGGSLEGRSFLDCACNGGGHTLAALRMGAGAAFGFDARQQWVDQARFLAQFSPHPDVSFETLELNQLPGHDPGQFDVTLFSGIFYHLPDPIHGLKVAADRTRDILILNTAAYPRRGHALHLIEESATERMSGVNGIAWLASGPVVLQRVLAWCGFPASRLHWHKKTSDGWSRLQLIAARDERSFEHFDRCRPDLVGSRWQRLAVRARHLAGQLRPGGGR